ncbi:MAG: GNAT family N-acetyltransferase [Terriglobales bacterium]|jgi:ribosomal protein S18 acetylase RimI-like enzyme
MEILDLRHFSSADLRPLLEDEIAMWGRLLSWDYTTSAEMILRYMDAKILPGYAAIERGSIFGYSFFVYEQNKGVIGDLFVRESVRAVRESVRESVRAGAGESDGHAVEERLLTHVIETLQQSPGIHRVEAQLLAHSTGEVAGPFLRTGFSRHPRVFMNFEIGRHPQASPGLQPALPPQFEIRPWSDDEYQSAAAVITAAYRGHVDSEINDQYRTLTGSLRFLNNIVRFPGCGTFDAHSSFVVYQRRTRTLVGLILCSLVRSDVGHITQVCVLPEYRSAGLGEVMLAASTRNLRGRGLKFISLTVTEANDRAIALYKRIGFESKRVFDAFVWEG